MTENCFWAKAKEDKLERKDIFEELSQMFAAKSAPKKLDKADGGENEHVQKKKVKQLTVLDPKSAQNMCKYYYSNVSNIYIYQYGIPYRYNTNIV